MNEQQLQQILTIQQAIAAAATAAVINSLLNPQQQQQQAAAGDTSSPTGQIDTNNRTAQDLLLHLQQQAVAANLTQQQQHQHHNDADQHERPDSRLDSPAETGSPLQSANGQQIDTNNQTIQNLLVQLQQQAAAGSNPLPAINNASALAALNLNLNNQISSQMPNISSGNSPIGRSQMVQNDPFHSASPTTSGNIQQSNQMQGNKKLKRYHQPQPNPIQRSSQEATSKPHSSPKNHSTTMSNLTTRNNNSSSTTNSPSSASSAFLPNNVGLPRKLVRGQDVWLGRGAEQTRQILKCMWCGQSFRTLAEMTQHMKVTQHYTNIISQEQITSWKQPEGSDSSLGKQSSRHSSSSKLLEEAQDTSSEKFNDSDRDDSFSNDDEPPQKSRNSSKSRQSEASKSAGNAKIKRDSSEEATEQSQTVKSTTKRLKQENEHRQNRPEPSVQDDSDAENSSASVVSSQRKLLSSSVDALKGNDANNKIDGSVSPDEKIKIDASEERASESNQSDDESKVEESESPEPGARGNSNGKAPESPTGSKEDDKDSELDDREPVNKVDQADDDHERNEASGDERKHNNDDCDKITKKRSRDKSLEMEVIKQVAEGPRGDGSGDPLSALETMVEKSFDPRMRPGLASGGILQRLGIDEEVCPPWQHINYANWYAAAAYGHPMAAALLAAGMNLQNGIKLSKNTNQKKGDE